MTKAARLADGRATVAVAVSGGRDSIALLHATLRAATAFGLDVVALHVHHGLMADADAWAAAVEAQCERWSREGRPVRFACTRLRGAPAAGESVEAWARRERYAALARMAREAGATLVLLGHHRRDQAETVLLQALRGAGPAGLAAMPRVAERDGLTWARPWLDRPDEALAAYADAAGLAVVIDPSNADPRYARSRLRKAVMPALRVAFSDAETALAATARRAQEARAVLDEVAADDLRRLDAAERLPLGPWRALSAPRRANALRAWLAARLGRSAPETLVQRLLDETLDDAPRGWPAADGLALRSWRGGLSVLAASAGRAALVGDAAGHATALPDAVPLSLLRCDRHDVPGWRGRLELFATEAEGIAPHRLAAVVARARTGGERFQRRPAGTARSLKKQYQAAGVDVDGREGPLLFDAAGALLFAPGLGIDARVWAPPGAPQWGVRWLPAPRTKAGAV